MLLTKALEVHIRKKHQYSIIHVRKNRTNHKPNNSKRTTSFDIFNYTIRSPMYIQHRKEFGSINNAFDLSLGVQKVILNRDKRKVTTTLTFFR